MIQAGDPPSDEAVQESVRQVLAGSEFGNTSEISVMERVFSLLVDMLSALREWAAASEWGAPIVVTVLVILLASIIAHLVITVSREVGRVRSGSQRKAGTGNVDVFEGRATGFDDALDKARNALAAGDLHQAVWLLHRLLLGVLDREGHLRFKSWKTNARYLLECRPEAPLYPVLVDLTEAYDEVVYAHRTYTGDAVTRGLNALSVTLGRAS